LIDQILEKHNSLRNELAGGSMQFAPAGQMAVMTWNDDMAYLASLNVKQCAMKHDKCRGIPENVYSGQNLFRVSYSGSTYSDSFLADWGMQSWWDENKDCTQAQIDAYPSSTEK